MGNWKTDLNPMMESVLASGTENKFNDFHAKITIQFGELIESGFDWGENDYFKNVSPNFETKHRARLNQKIKDRYYWREICCVPPGQFKHFLVRKLNEIMPKYNELYFLNDDGDVNILRKETYNGKSRSVHSEYPQSQLSDDNDYATDANDNADGHTLNGAPIDMIVDYQERYNDIDVMILNELNVCFLSMMTLSINGGV